MDKIELEDVTNIGPATAEQLKNENITAPSQLAIMRADELAGILGKSKKQAQKMINSARNIAPPILMTSAKEVKEYRKKHIQYLKTGSRGFDRLLRGGVSTDAIYGFTGALGSGKTQACKQIAESCANDLNREVVWIQTERRTFVPERLEEMAEAKGRTVDLSKFQVIGEFMEEEVDGEIRETPLINTPTILMRALERTGHYIEQEGHDVGLVVVDSYSAPFRDWMVDRSMLPDRAKEMARQFGYFNQMAARNNTAIVLTCQVMGNPVAKGSGMSKKKYSIPYSVWGGHVQKHAVTYWISFYERSGVNNLYEATTFDCPLPRDSVEFKIDERGVHD